MLISLTCSEITIKGRKRNFFEKLLSQNIRNSLSGLGSVKVEKGSGRLIITLNSEDKALTREILSKTFGIDNFYFPITALPDINEIKNVVAANSHLLKGKKIKVETKRSDKKFPIQSQEVNRIIGKLLVDSGCGVDLDAPDVTVYIEILPKQVLISFGRMKGLGGMPIGASGKLLSLVSGGIDSPVASWLMMKRGCRMDFIHVFQSSENLESSKIIRLVKILRAFSPYPMRIYAVPYDEFYKKSISIDSRIELVLFKRFLMHLSNALSADNGYLGVVNGDSVAQVASQTVENIYATDMAAKIPVFRPLVAFNKQEIIDIAEKIGTFQTSLEPYKDCCSLVAASNPRTKVPIKIAEESEKKMDMESVVKKSLEQVKIFDI